jgi:NitT/TauT family transport system permease protein
MSAAMENSAAAKPSRAIGAPRRAWSAGLALPAATLSVAVVVLLLWEFLPPALGVPKYVIPRVSDLWVEMGRMWRQEDLAMHLGSTATWAVVGFVLGGIFGAAFGYLLGMSEFWEKVLSPYILALQIAPKVAFAPLFIMWFGYNAMPKLLVTVLIVFFPVLVNVLQAMRTVDRDLVNLARAYNLSRWGIFLKVEMPSTVPNLMAGCASPRLSPSSA